MVNPWPMVKIGDIFEFKNGLSKGKEFFGQGTPFISYVDVYKHNGLTAADIKGRVLLSEDEIRKLAVKKRDVFFTRTSETPEEVGYSAVLLEDVPNCVYNGFVLRARPRNDLLNIEYCKYCFSTRRVREEISKRCKYTTRAGITGRALSEIEIPLPSAEEQKAIAETITSMENYIVDLFQLIEKKKAIRDGTLNDLISGKTRLRTCAGTWITTTIDSITKDVITGGTPSTLHPEYWNGTIPWLASTEIHQKMVEKETTCITEHGLSHSSARIAPRGSVLIALAGQGKTRGTAAFLLRDMALNQSLAALIVNEKCDAKFLFYLMESQYQQLREVSSGDGGRGGLNKKLIRNFEVRIPSNVVEQGEIAEILTSMDEEIKALEVEREKIIQIREGAMDDLLTGRVRLSV